MERFYFGTWQLGGDFRKISSQQATKLINHALDAGITRFDTARVYGRGLIEELLGSHFRHRSDIRIVTKVPARGKPSLDLVTEAMEYYPDDVLAHHITLSAQTLGDGLDAILLHNWSPYWIQSDVVLRLRKLAPSGVRIGISLPDNYPGDIESVPINEIDVLMVPHNRQEIWLNDNLHLLKQETRVEILVRSLFRQGIDTMTAAELRNLDSTDRRSGLPIGRGHTTIDPLRSISQVSSLGFSCVIGMTTPKQIQQNIKSFKPKQQ